MISLDLDSRLDIHLDENGQISIASGRKSYSDIIANVVRTQRGEILFYPNLGIDYFNTIFASTAKTFLWKNLVIDAVSALDFVDSIDGFDASYDAPTKTLSYTLTVNTDMGTLTVTQ